jgi:hypothetical protein
MKVIPETGHGTKLHIYVFISISKTENEKMSRRNVMVTFVNGD